MAKGNEPISIPQASFTSGELSPNLYGRIDLERYFTGLRTCRNFVVLKYGGVQNRGGTKFITEVNDSTHLVRLIGFEFSTSQTYVLELGLNSMRVIKNGALVAVSGVPVNFYTPWLDTDLALLKFTQSNDVITVTHPNYPPQQISRYSDTNWTISAFQNVNGPFLDLNVDNTKTMKVNSVTGSAIITANFSAFDSTHIGQLIYIGQAPDSATPTWQVVTATAVSTIVRAGENYYKAMTAGTTGTIEPSVTEGMVTDGTPGVKWKYLHSGFGIALITGVTDSQHATVTILSYMPDTLVSFSVLDLVNGLTPGDGVSIPVTINIPNHNFTNGQSVTVAGVTGTVGANGNQVITVVDLNNFTLNGVVDSTPYTGGGTVLNNTVATPSYSWAFEAWGSSEGYPGTTGFYQQRQCFAGMTGHPATIEMSRTAGYTDFGVSNPVVDDDAITAQAFASKAIEIRHLLELSYLVLLTSGGVFAMFGGSQGDGVVTPSTVQIKPQSANAVSNVPPIRVDHVALFVQSKGSQVRSLAYSFADNTFVGDDITTNSSHLFLGYTIVDWCYQETPNSIIWAVRSDGALLGLTFVPNQQVNAWHRHDSINGFVESCTCITENNEDVVYLSVRRTINGVQKRYDERMDTRAWTNPVNAWLVDCGLSYSGAPAQTFTGLGHLEGQTVSILADGMVHPQLVVTGGSITLQYLASTVIIGLPITSDFETLEITMKGGSLLEKNKIISKMSLVLNESMSINYGPDVNHLMQHKQRTIENYNDPVQPFSGVITDPLLTNWGKPGRVFIRQSDPLPVTILGVIPEVTAGGS